MDYLKRATCKNYTAWDLNCPRIVQPDNDLRRKFKRAARRKAKQEDKKTFSEILQETLDKQE
ncbi:MAG: hypothetical protein NC218_07310 [Acetobacter sp.]|nr:hypothetical protein [Acetobacter sp.]